MQGAHFLGDRQHDDGERHEHHGQEEVVQEAEEPLIHVPCHGVRDERVRQQRQHHSAHGDDRGMSAASDSSPCSTRREIMPSHVSAG